MALVLPGIVNRIRDWKSDLVSSGSDNPAGIAHWHCSPGLEHANSEK